MRILDLYSGAGGAAMGYHQAWPDAEIVGVDCCPQPRYPFEFIQAEALEFLTAHGNDFDFIHASPPCQAYSHVSGKARRRNPGIYPKLIEPTRAILRALGKPWVMENVEGAPLLEPFRLCGSMFGLDVRRHRLFESNCLIVPPICRHHLQTPRFRTLDSGRAGRLACVVGVHGHINYAGESQLRQSAMGINWMSNTELCQAIPPAYTRFIALQLATNNRMFAKR